MQFRLAPIIGLFALLLIALTSTRAAVPQRLYLPFMLASTAVGEQAPIAPLPSATLTPSAAPSSTALPSVTATATSSATATATMTPSATATATVTETATFTATATATPSVTATATATPSATITVTPTPQPTVILSPPVIITSGTVSFWPEYAEWSMNGINQVCTPYSDGVWRSTIPPEHFQPIVNLTYPDVGEVFLTNLETRNQYMARIKADISGRLSYSFDSLRSGDYELVSYLFYKHPLDPAALPRIYRQIDTGTGEVSGLRITIGPGPNRTWPDLQLRLSGEICPQP